MAGVLGWTSPHPGLGSPVKLNRGNSCGLLDLLGIGKTLPGQGIAAKQPPPALLQIEPARSRRNEDVMDAWIPFQPGARFHTVVTAEIVTDDEQVSGRVIDFDVGQERDVAFGIA